MKSHKWQMAASLDGTGLRAPGWLSWLSVQLLVSAHVMTSQFVTLSPMSGSVPTVRSLLGLLSLFLSLSAPLLFSLSQNEKIHVKKIFFKKETMGLVE